jgi:predicted DNA-binding transcriptional regulator YafY
MPDRITKTQRWIDLISFLIARRFPVSQEQIFESIPWYARRFDPEDTSGKESLRRTFERDKDELRKVGVPIETVRYGIDKEPYDVDGYVLKSKEFFLPYLKLIRDIEGHEDDVEQAAPTRGTPTIELEERDASTALQALREVADMPAFPFAEEARSASRKLSFDLIRPVGRESDVLNLDEEMDAGLRERMRELSDALLSRKRVTFSYHGLYRGEQTERDVAPYGLLLQRGNWYLIGDDALRDAQRVFRVARMDRVKVNHKAPGTPDYEVPGDFSLDAYRDKEAWQLASPGEEYIVARVRFPFPLSLWANRNGLGELEEEGAEGDAVRRFKVYQVDPFLRWMLSLVGGVTILEPPELRMGLRAVARETLTRYDAEGDHG